MGELYSMSSRRAAQGSASVSQRELLLFRKLPASRTPSRSACASEGDQEFRFARCAVALMIRCPCSQ